VIDISEERNEPMYYVNPAFEVLNEDSYFSFEEGCLSVPGFNEEITRPDNIILKWQDIDGKEQVDKPSGLLTVCIQHEIDHLDGKLMVDYISPIKRDRIKKKLLKK
jgi:peptide deformylase